MKAFKILFQTICLLLIIKHSFSWPIPHTGQTKCYNEITPVPCPKKGEQYYGQDAQNIVNPRSYTKLDKNGKALPKFSPNWAMVKDNLTDLIWEVKTKTSYNNSSDKKIFNLDYWIDLVWNEKIKNSPIHDKNTKFTFDEAKNIFIKKLNEINFGGFSDWRLPNIYELHSIVNYGKWDPAIDQFFFPNTMTDNTMTEFGCYWTSSALCVCFEMGNDRSKVKESSLNFVRAVRSE